MENLILLPHKPLTKPTLKFANHSIYWLIRYGGIHYISNVIVRYYSENSPNEQQWPLYQIYYNPGTRTWGILRCTSVPAPSGLPQRVKEGFPFWAPDFNTALEKARAFYEMENLENLNYDIAFATFITREKRTGVHSSEFTYQKSYFWENPRLN